MHVVVDVGASDPKDRRYTKTMHCVIVFVAADEQGNAVEIEHWRPATEKDAVLEGYAKRLMKLRKGIEETEANLPGALPL